MMETVYATGLLALMALHAVIGGICASIAVKNENGLRGVAVALCLAEVGTVAALVVLAMR